MCHLCIYIYIGIVHILSKKKKYLILQLYVIKKNNIIFNTIQGFLVYMKNTILYYYA